MDGSRIDPGAVRHPEPGGPERKSQAGGTVSLILRRYSKRTVVGRSVWDGFRNSRDRAAMLSLAIALLCASCTKTATQTVGSLEPFAARRNRKADAIHSMPKSPAAIRISRGQIGPAESHPGISAMTATNA